MDGWQRETQTENHHSHTTNSKCFPLGDVVYHFWCLWDEKRTYNGIQTVLLVH